MDRSCLKTFPVSASQALYSNKRISPCKENKSTFKASGVSVQFRVVDNHCLVAHVHLANISMKKTKQQMQREGRWLLLPPPLLSLQPCYVLLSVAP